VTVAPLRLISQTTHAAPSPRSSRRYDTGSALLRVVFAVRVTLFARFFVAAMRG
jgi:hypothetical protein